VVIACGMSVDDHAVADVEPHADEQAMAAEAFRGEQEAGELKIAKVALLSCVAGLLFALRAACATSPEPERITALIIPPSTTKTA
jgi:hypothetical protein